MSEQPTQPTQSAIPRDGAWALVSGAVEHLVSSVAGAARVHADDVATMTAAVDHLRAVLDLAESRGWASSWARDNEKLDSARKFLEDLKLKETPHGTPSND